MAWDDYIPDFEALSRGIAQGASFGFMDEIGSALAAYKNATQNRPDIDTSKIDIGNGKGVEINYSPWRGMVDDYKKYRDDWRAKDASASERSPWSFIAGSLPPSIGMGSGVTSIPGNIALGAAYGLGSSTDSPFGGAVSEGVTSGVGTAVGNAASPWLNMAGTIIKFPFGRKPSKEIAKKTGDLANVIDIKDAPTKESAKEKLREALNKRLESMPSQINTDYSPEFISEGNVTALRPEFSPWLPMSKNKISANQHDVPKGFDWDDADGFKYKVHEKGDGFIVTREKNGVVEASNKISGALDVPYYDLLKSEKKRGSLRWEKVKESSDSKNIDKTFDDFMNDFHEGDIYTNALNEKMNESMSEVDELTSMYNDLKSSGYGKSAKTESQKIADLDKHTKKLNELKYDIEWAQKQAEKKMNESMTNAEYLELMRDHAHTMWSDGKISEAQYDKIEKEILDMWKRFQEDDSLDAFHEFF